VIVDSRLLERECLAQGLRSKKLDLDVVACASITEWRAVKDKHPDLAAVLYSIGGQKPTDPAISAIISKLVADFADVPVVVLADTDDLIQILKALELGAKGYIPTSVHIDVCVEAINLALAGGVFLPASSVVAMRKAIETGGEVARPMARMFTQRQEEVVSALRKGKANKIIAYELKLRESTVKVHIRNIMKKLKATNRTEVAYKINELFPHDVSASG
jgi:DNA-binding NarL/FixJ family response regulator